MNTLTIEKCALKDPLAIEARPVVQRRSVWIAVLVLVILGTLLRVVPTAGFSGLGFDESLYRSYLLMLDQKGLGQFPEITSIFIEDQRKPESITKLPPTRFLYIFSGWMWKKAQFGDAGPADISSRGGLAKDPALVSLENVSCAFSVLLMLIATAAAWRMFGTTTGIGVLALMACAPLQIHMAQHALIDVYFAFWATLSMWALWECLKQPRHLGWLVLYGVALMLMVMTKENSFFVFSALVALVVMNRWGKWGEVTKALLITTFLAPLLGVLALVALAGGFQQFFETYLLLVTKAQNLTYAIKTGDGPWHRYLVDLMIVSPVVLCLALGCAFNGERSDRNRAFLIAFVIVTYLIMCNVRYAMNLRYATVWDLPIRVFAFTQIVWISNQFPARKNVVVITLTAAVCAYELRQYLILFSDAGLYELVTEGLLRALKILK
jgi:hypothetical protein